MSQFIPGRFSRPSLAAHLLMSPLQVFFLLAMALSAGSSFAQQTGTVEALAEDEVQFSQDLAIETFEEVWSIINETHFDPQHLESIGWNQVREELRPQAAEAANNAELREVISEMLSRLEQSHFALIPAEAADAMAGEEDEAAPDDRDDDGDGDHADESDSSAAEGGADSDAGAGESEATAEDEEEEEESEQYAPDTPGTVGLDVRWLGERFVVTHVDEQSPAERAGVGVGWIIQSINDQALAAVLEEFPEDLEPRWLDMFAWQTVNSRLVGDAGTKVTVTFLNENDEPVELELRREPQRGEPTRFGNLPTFYARSDAEALTTEEDRPAGLIAFNIWMIPVMHPVREAIDRFRDAAGIIVDLRGNPGGIGGMSMGFAGLFIDERLTFGTMKTRGSDLDFVALPQRLSAAGELVEPYSGPVALLVDSLTGSTSEVFAGGMQSIGRMRIFGTTTMGAALPATMPRLANGDVLLHAFADFVDANGVRMEGRGVIPDEEVHLDRGALLRGEDPVLKAALAWIDEQAGGIDEKVTRDRTR